MEIFEFEGQLLEVDVVSDVGEEGMVAECWDISPDVGRGLLFSLRSRDSHLVLVAEADEIRVDLINRVVKVAGLESGAGSTS